MTRDQAIEELKKLVQSRQAIAASYRKKRWRESEKATAIAEVQAQVEALETAIQSLRENAPG